MKKILIVVVLIILAFYGYKLVQSENDTTTNSIIDVATDTSTGYAFTSTDFDDIPPTYVDSKPTSASDPILNSVVNSQPAPPVVATPSFSCDGRQHCSQMKSCAEATYFIQHCPNTKMDGNNDGIPCEQQWCH
ncbi:Excalibur calcium-binding domain-containing protein [Psychrobacter sp. LV10R520-6]|nr:Excalibur calcium-binding domain-containing protein [Psychrobacter sp. LV10R520-6]